MPSDIYTVDYFINKFEAVPEELWYVGEFRDPNNPKCRCVLGLCGVYGYTSSEGFYMEETTEESQALTNLIFFNKDVLGKSFFISAASINDGGCSIFKEDTPKKRILSALNRLKSAGVE